MAASGLLTILLFVAADEILDANSPNRSAKREVQRKQPLGNGAPRFVDGKTGDDSADGSRKTPWKTIRHAVTQLRPGDTLSIAEGVYFEHVVIRLQGTAKAPITIRAMPGARVVLDGGMPEFQTAPAKCWQPVGDKKSGEYRSTKTYPNLRNVIGSFGKSMIGLQTYYHAKDLRATNEKWDYENPAKPRESDVKPVYCGPGVWYDATTGVIYCRLAHTHLPAGNNYKSETDPRRIPLVLAPFYSVPLRLEGAKHVRIKGIEVRGGGYDTVIVDYCRDIRFDDVTIYAGTYGFRGIRLVGLSMQHCAIRGNAPPWTFRQDTGLRSYPGRPHRDITRLNTHALLVADAGREFSVHAFPVNNDWEISHCEFTDAHDGLYLGGITMKFHHNIVKNMLDDGVYLSPMYPRYHPDPAKVEVFQNYFVKCLTPLAFGGPELRNTDSLWIYRNIVDLRKPIHTGRPNSKNPKGGQSFGKIMGDHGSPPWSAMKIYHNTFIMQGGARFADMGTLNGMKPERKRYLFNNIFLHLTRMPGLRAPTVEQGQADGNLYWYPEWDAKKRSAFFNRYRKSPAFAQSKSILPMGFTANDVTADPKLGDDFRLQKSSAAINAGVALPKDWPDPLRREDAGRPDIGAIPYGMTIPKILIPRK